MNRRLKRCFVISVTWLAAAACAPSRADLTAEERAEIAGEIERTMREAVDLSLPNVSDRMLSLYPAEGRVISAAGGRVVASRETLAAGIRYFWDNVGVNMQQPVWMWDEFLVDVLGRDVAAVTARYHVPHQTPRGQLHVIGGAWTAVFRRDAARDGWVIVQEHLSDLPPEAADSIHAHTHPAMP